MPFVTRSPSGPTRFLSEGQAHAEIKSFSSRQLKFFHFTSRILGHFRTRGKERADCGLQFPEGHCPGLDDGSLIRADAGND